MPNNSGSRKRTSNGPIGNRPKKTRKNRKNNEEDVESDESVPEIIQDQPSPISDELMPKLPEVNIFFVDTNIFYYFNTN